MSSISELAKALNAFQSELVTVDKEANNPFFKSKYAPLATVMKVALPVLTKHGLSVMQLPNRTEEGRPALTTIVMHTSGESREATVPLLLDKDNSQGLGSAITYMRRYAFAAALQIVIDEDDDGNKASTPKKMTKNMKPITEKQLDWLRNEANKAIPEYETRDLDEWLASPEVLGISPQKIPIFKFKDALDKIVSIRDANQKTEDSNYQESLDNAVVTDKDVQDFEEGKLPY